MPKEIVSFNKTDDLESVLQVEAAIQYQTAGGGC
jgi:hypothetical protein